MHRVCRSIFVGLSSVVVVGCSDFGAVDPASIARLTVSGPASEFASGLDAEASGTFVVHNDGSVGTALSLDRASLLGTSGDVLEAAPDLTLTPPSVAIEPGDSVEVSVRFSWHQAGLVTLNLDLRSAPVAFPEVLEVSLPFEILGDWDGDGADHPAAGGSDCDDEDPSVYPSAPETWYDGIDQDCDGNDNDADVDGSDYRWDCDDQDPNVYPGAVEIWYDGVDQDCDGNDGDADGDGFLAEVAGGSDCDDEDAAVHPSAADGGRPLVDDDCDGLFDEDNVSVGDVIIAEVMRVPSTGGADAVWFELVNVAEEDRVLTGWTVHTDLASGMVVFAEGQSPALAPDGLLVVCADFVSAQDVGVPCGAVLEPWPTPLPGADSLEVRLESIAIDRIQWTSAWPGAVGAAMSLSLTAADHELNDDPRSWCVASEPWAIDSDLGTPGEANPTCE